MCKCINMQTFGLSIKHTYKRFFHLYFKLFHLRMLLHIFVIIAVTSSFAVADDNVCFDASAGIKQLQPATCKAEMKTNRNAKAETCYSKYHTCHLREIGVLNDAKNGVDHDKMVKLLTKFATEKDTLATKLSGCNKSGSGLKISQYFDCIQEKCPEMAKLRQAIKASAVGVC